MENEGDEQPDIQAGHLVFVVRTALHPIFRREGDDLHVDVHITLAEVLMLNVVCNFRRMGEAHDRSYSIRILGSSCNLWRVWSTDFGRPTNSGQLK